MARDARSTTLIAEFNNGLASGWAFQVNECFRDQLDIKLLFRTRTKPKNPQWKPRTEEEFKSHVENLPGVVGPAYRFVDTNKQGKSVIRWRFQQWSQGSRYCFSRGHTIYTNDGLAIQVIEADPCDPGGDPVGRVVFILLKEMNVFTPVGLATLTQNEFVSFLKIGVANFRLFSGYAPGGRLVEAKPNLLSDSERAKISKIIKQKADTKADPSIYIHYKDSHGKVTRRQISQINSNKPGTITAYCHLRDQVRSFHVENICEAALTETGEIIEDFGEYLRQDRDQ